MGILQRYVLAQLLKVFSLLLLALTCMLVVVGVAGQAAKHGLGPEQIVQILPWVVPSLMPYTIPATLLLTVCVVYGRMAGDQEVTAIKAAGISVISALWPAFILASLLSLGTFLLTDYFIPLATTRIQQIVTLAMEDIFLDGLRTRNQFTDADRGIAISVDRVDGRKLINPVIRYAPPPGGRATTITARSAELKFDMPQMRVVMTFENGLWHTPDGKSLRFNHEEMPFPLPARFDKPAPRNTPVDEIRNEMKSLEVERRGLLERRVISTAFQLTLGQFDRFSADESRNYDRRLNDANHRWTKLNTEIHSRVALACSCFFFTLLGAPFAVLQGRRQFLTSFALCFLPILTLYYPAIILTMELSKDNKLNPAWGMWLGNAGMLSLAGVVLRRVTKH
ncbi:MAG: LptF/LptG family permease [Planctomycetaceae bacterium]